jgi:C_GCAxxG_C_C family probable redox protein
MNVGSKEVFKAGSALAGGVARQGETCGALTGAIMAVCSVVGRERLEDRDQYGKAMEEAARVYDRFKQEVGHTICAEIQKILFGKTYRLIVPEERTAFHESGGHSRTGCPKVCGIAARIAAATLLDLKKKKEAS